MTIEKSLDLSVQKLTKHHFNSAHLDAEILLSFTLGKSKEFLYSHPEYTLTSKQLQKFHRLITRRAKGEPIAFLIGHKEFYGLDFFVNKNVLIPRPETELMIEAVLDYIKTKLKSKINNLQFIDIGTGSGCIPISIAKNLYNASSIKYYGLDISNKALITARRNAKINHVSKKINFLQSNLLKNILNNLYLIPNTNLIITANLPYLTQKQYYANPGLRYEPKNALVAGHDGLKYYRALIKQIKSLINAVNNPPSITLFLEIDPGQTKIIQKVIHYDLPKAQILVKKDLAGLNRLIIVKLLHPSSHSERR